LRWLGDVTINRPYGSWSNGGDPVDKLGELPATEPPPGTKQLLSELGPEGFARWMRDNDDLLVTDTTLRDAHQSVLATRVRTLDLVAGAAHVAHASPELLSLECWGGATYDVALRFLHEDPWERLEQFRDAVPNLCLQMLLRGRNTLGYTAYPDEVCQRFVGEAHRSGVDVFRVFDALNNLEQMRPAIDAVLDAGALVEGTLCYSGDLSSPSENLYTLDYYLRVAEGLAEAGAHVLCIKDMAGLLRAPAAATLVAALRARFDQPVHLHTHDTGGGQLATYLAAANAGVDAVDGAAAPLSGMTSQPALSAIVAAFTSSDRQTQVTLDGLARLEPYWEAVRKLYRPFEAGMASPTGTVYQHEIPGGQLSNLRQQALALGLGDRFEEIEQMYAACDDLLGRIIKVTPTSKVVGDLALALVASGTTTDELRADPAAADLPDSVIGFLHGELGTPVGGFPQPFTTDALHGRREAVSPAPLAADDKAGLAGDEVRATLSRLLFPAPATDYAEHRETYGDLSRLPTRLFLYGMNVGESDAQIRLARGVNLLLSLDAIGEPDAKGMRRVVFRLNGQLRPIDVLDQSVDVTDNEREQIDPGNPGHVGAPFTGVATIQAEIGERVSANQAVAVIEAMKMESVISAPIAGVVDRLAIPAVASVEAGDLLLVLRPD
ncbi:MAG: biotin/lipoyl-containing protein, partial [Acidimicrobiales bacterium]